MRIAVVGAGGQLGRELRRRLAGQVVPLTRADLELTDAAGVRAALSAAGPDVVINAAAYNLVDRAEQEPEAAFAVNALGPRYLAEVCAARDISLVHVSTDYVFSGWTGEQSGDQIRSVPYVETDLPHPLSVYGTSKLAGEWLVRQTCPRHFVVRTCGLFGPTTAPGQGNFVQTMLRLGRERGELAIVDDQTCCPTSTADLARAIEALLASDAYGLYHAANAGQTTWCGFAREIFRLAQIDVAVRSISSREYGAAARRPGYSVLDSGKLTATVELALPSWQDALERYLEDEVSLP